MKKLKKIRDFIRKHDFDLRKLKELGFVRKYTFSASEKIWIHYRKGIVVKIPCIVRKKKDFPKYAIPTLTMDLPKDKIEWKDSRRVFIQPKACLINAALAHIRLIDMGYHGNDFKEKNTGWYRGKPVLIDW